MAVLTDAQKDELEKAVEKKAADAKAKEEGRRQEGRQERREGRRQDRQEGGVIPAARSWPDQERRFSQPTWKSGLPRRGVVSSRRLLHCPRYHGPPARAGVSGIAKNVWLLKSDTPVPRAGGPWHG